MNIQKQVLPKSQLELTIEVSLEELKPYLKQAVNELSEKNKIEGFRPGKAPYEIVKQRLGDMAILQQATNSIIGKTFYQAIEQEGVEIVNQPQIDIIKMAPDNPFVYKATVALLPKVELCDYKNLKVKPIEEIQIKDEEVEKVIQDLRKMRAKEVLVEREAKDGDKVEVDFETFVDQVPIAGGKAEKYALVIGDKQMIPGFEDQLIGLKKDQPKEFELTFPKDYHNDKIAGKQAKFKVKMLAVYQRELPEVNEDFAKGMGLKSTDDLKSHLRNNLKMEKQNKAKQKQDLEIVNQIIEKSKFDDLPDSLVNAEVEKMMAELKDNVMQQGLNFEDYLNHLKKKESDLKLDFTPDAIKRVKTGLAIRQIAVQENLSASEEEIHAEADRTLQTYQVNPMYAEQLQQIEKNIKSEASHRYFANVIVNRKVMELLRKTMVGQ
jgi:trigger factor